MSEVQRFRTIETKIPDLFLLQRQVIQDHRGSFSRLYCQESFAGLGVKKPLRQTNFSFTRQKGSFRGLHFQRPPFAETKIITCLRGEVFDIALDLRQGSPTFLQWHAEILSAENQHSFLLPEGFAHGFQTLTDNCELLYMHTQDYKPEAEGGILYSDPLIALTLPLPISDISQRDQQHPLLDERFKGVTQ